MSFTLYFLQRAVKLSNTLHVRVCTIIHSHVFHDSGKCILGVLCICLPKLPLKSKPVYNSQDEIEKKSTGLDKLKGFNTDAAMVVYYRSAILLNVRSVFTFCFSQSYAKQL